MTSSSSVEAQRERRMVWLVALLTLLPALLPLVLRTWSAGDDLPFHLGSWGDAGQQLRHGIWPRWDFSAAYGAGEPRFVFYPPLSWLLGAVLTWVAPGAWASVLFIAVALALCWGTMFRTVRAWTDVPAAALAASAYAASPYVLYDALQRGALAELLATAWLPLLFGALLWRRVRVGELAAAVALLWLTNVPTAVIGSYMVLLIGLFRVGWMLWAERDEECAARMRSMVVAVTVGTVMGVMLAGFFLVPAVHQQAWVQLSAAFAPGQAPGDNFLLRHTADTRRGVIHAVSLLAAEYTVAAGMLGALWVLVRRRSRSGDGRQQREMVPVASLLAFGAAVFLMLPLSSLLWRWMPELRTLQFPWRLLCVMALTVAVLLGWMAREMFAGKRALACVAAVGFGWVLCAVGVKQYWIDEHGVDPHGVPWPLVVAATERRVTVEYSPAGTDAGAVAPGFPAVRVEGSDGQHGMGEVDVVQEAPVRASADAPGPDEVRSTVAGPGVVVLNRRGYPSWDVTLNGKAAGKGLQRADGRIAVQVPAGVSTVAARWHEGSDETVGGAFTVIAAAVLGWWERRVRGREPESGNARVWNHRAKNQSFGLR